MPSHGSNTLPRTEQCGAAGVIGRYAASMSSALGRAVLSLRKHCTRYKWRSVNFESPLHKSNQARNQNSTVAIKIKIFITTINVYEVLVEKYHGNEDASRNTRCV